MAKSKRANKDEGMSMYEIAMDYTILLYKIHKNEILYLYHFYKLQKNEYFLLTFSFF